MCLKSSRLWAPFPNQCFTISRELRFEPTARSAALSRKCTVTVLTVILYPGQPWRIQPHVSLGVEQGKESSFAEKASRKASQERASSTLFGGISDITHGILHGASIGLYLLPTG